MWGPCDIQNLHYMDCSYCEDGKCKPGCQDATSCGPGYTCEEGSHKCNAIAGKELLQSIGIRTAKGCSACSPEGVFIHLLGEKNGQYLDGTPCNTSVLNHTNTVDYGGGFGTWTTFDGTLDGNVSQEEINMMGSCYKVGPEITVSLLHRTFPGTSQCSTGGRGVDLAGEHGRLESPRCLCRLGNQQLCLAVQPLSDFTQ